MRSAQTLDNPIIRTAIAAAAIVGCLVVVWISARAGYARILSKYALATASLPAADLAVRLTPSDPEARRARAAVLRYLDQLPDAAKEYEAAVSLRYHDDLLWMDLGSVRDETDNAQGAVAALNESVRMAPYYAHPRWQRGNVLFRMGRYDEAFADLKQAARSNRNLLPNLIDLTWFVSKADPKLTERILEIDSPQMRLAFARFLARKGRGREAIDQLRQVGPVSPEVRSDMVVQLIAQKAFREAFEIWSSAGANEKQRPEIYDGGFEGSLSLSEGGFGWRVTGQDGLGLSVDESQKAGGTKSLRIQFQGNSDPNKPVLSQLIIIEPSKRYRVNFSARSQEVVSGGLPVFTVTDARSGQLLGKSPPVRQGTNEWQAESFEFASSADSSAISLNLQRESCASTPCPIFGVVWLDNFSIQQISK